MKPENNHFWGWRRSGWETRWKEQYLDQDPPKREPSLTCPLCGKQVPRLVKTEHEGKILPACEECNTERKCYETK